MRLLLLLLMTLPMLAEDYVIGPDSMRQPGVPKGVVTQHEWKSSKIYPGTVRSYWVYVPAQYKASEPAALMIMQDGGGAVREDAGYRMTLVMDNLIHKNEMPVTIGIFVNPGVMPPISPTQQGRYNRSYEYDAMGGRYAQFLTEEIIPEVSKQYNITKDPNLRAVAGGSSGGIAAFTAAWNRPDAFRRVLSFIGSFTDLRGGDTYSGLIRKTEPKPLRIFQQDGSNDQNIYSGNWYIANQDVANALEWAGYDAKFVVGTEGHNGKHGAAILPEAMRWLWADWTKPIVASKAARPRQYVTQYLDPARDWEVVSSGHRFTEGPAVDKDGSVYFSDIPNNRIHKIGLDGKVSVFKEDSGGVNGLMFGPDGRLYACQNGRKRIVAYSKDGSETVIAEGVGSNDIAVSAKNEIYFTEPAAKKVWFIDSNKNKRVVFEGPIDFPNGVRLSPDQSLLLVADMRNKWVWSFQIQPDGSLANEQAFHHLETPDENSQSGADGMTLDDKGELYVATKLGIQICDQPGRVVAIINKPQPGSLSNVVFGGPGLDYLYATAGDKVFRRHMRRKGVFPWEPVKPPTPQL